VTEPADRIELRGLRALGICGALPEEQGRLQPLEIDIDIALDLRTAGASDALEDTLDYGAVCAMADRVVGGERHALLEHVGERIAELVLADERVTEVTVTVRKLRPPVPQHLATAGVRVTRSAERRGG